MGDLLVLNKPIYMLLPLDEAPFIINANARTISVPAEFTKCGAVKGDNYCEIATFVIDRYFDFKDLAEAQIAVQWINANKEEGISHIQLIDYESEEGKIRFGWPLVADITKYPGQVQFAVRFFVKEEGTDKFHYLFNTQTATLNIKDSLNVISPKHEYENDINEFKHFVSNSQNPAYTIPASPFFTTINGGIDLPKYEAINLSDNTLTLKAQAVAADLGDITYKWFYIPSGSDAVRELTNDGNVYELEMLKHVKVENIPEKKGLDKYWIKTGSDEAESYELYSGEWPPAEDIELYEVITSLKMVDSTEDVVGEYWVEATNTVRGTATIINSTNPVPSTHCIIPAPQHMSYIKNLPYHMFMSGNPFKADLVIELKADSNKPNISYAWYKSTTGINDDDFELIMGAESATYSATEAGWYKAIPIARLNRKTESEKSNICKVTMLPAAPVIMQLSYKLEDDLTYQVLDKDNDTMPSYKFGDIINLKINTNLDNASELESEALIYNWYVQEPENLPRKLTDKDIGANTLLKEGTVLNSNEIKVRCIADDTIYNYFCVITNTIQDKSAEVNSSSYNTFIIV